MEHTSLHTYTDHSVSKHQFPAHLSLAPPQKLKHHARLGVEPPQDFEIPRPPQTWPRPIIYGVAAHTRTGDSGVRACVAPPRIRLKGDRVDGVRYEESPDVPGGEDTAMKSPGNGENDGGQAAPRSAATADSTDNRQ